MNVAMEMQTELTDSELALQLSTTPTTNLQKAWYISSLLRSLGRPAKSIELSSMCTQFYATPNFVEYLCGIPNSPIFLTPGCFVTTSSNGYVPHREITENFDSKLKNFPPYGLEMVLGQRVDEEAVKVYFRKRRKIGSDSRYWLLELETELSDSEAGNVTELQKAWYIFALLLSFGRPARSIELACKCALFFITPGYVEFLAGMPNSPIYFTPDYFVTISSIGYISAREIAENLNTELKVLPPYGFEIASGQGINVEAVKTYFRQRRKVRSDDEYLSVPKKRAFLDNFEEDQNAPILALPCSTGNPSGKVYLPNGNMSSAIELQSCNSEILAHDVLQKEKVFFGEPLFNGSTSGHFNTGLEDDESGKGNAMGTLVNASEVSNPCGIRHHFNPVEDDIYQPLSISGSNVSKAIQSREINFSIVQSPAISTTKEMDDNSSIRNIDFLVRSVMEVGKETNTRQCQTEAQSATHVYGTKLEDLEKTEGREEGPSLNSCCSIRDTGNQPINTAEKDKQPEGKPVESFIEASEIRVSSPKKEKSRTRLKSKASLIDNSLSLCDQRVISSPKPKPDLKRAANQRLQSIGKPLENSQIDHPLQVSKRDKKSILSKQNIKYNYNQVMNAKEKKEACNVNVENSSIVASDQLDQRELPDFEAFIAEEQEGSGGYGTVYKARRKSDGVTYAIKYPHANANRNHVHNELKMLERFGGKNFVIKYEGSFKRGNSDCLVLEHVEHDRPEVLKRDIDVQELQWYGYCMFKALAGLHKQGVVHRDVKPGNFLFNRKACKGYLIDFNLAMDLTQKHSATINKAKAVQDLNLNRVPLPNEKSLPSTKSRKLVAKALEVANQEQRKVSKSLLPSKNMKNEIRRPKTCNEVGSMNLTKSQGAEASGVTSAKDATSTRTPSGEKIREPLPWHRSKELISLAHEALQTRNHKAVGVPVSKRKRIAAPPRQTDCKFIYVTPMPLHSAGVAVGGAGLLKNKGDGKHNREGSCVGTKGFRAPEVLVRSLHQGSMVDTWSAGVTLLYLMIGRTPFAGDPDQNMKEIAKLRGSEDLWEVAKLHNRESSFPAELLDVKYLRSLKLQDWCKQNTRRPEFLDRIPRSLFDLVDKCLTVNPRLRISAEEALRHEFFYPCHEALRNHRLLKQGVSADIGSNLILNGQSQTYEEIS